MNKFIRVPGMPLVWGSDHEFAGLMLGDTLIFFDDAIRWISYVVLP